jgi:hypothetical protein
MTAFWYVDEAADIEAEYDAGIIDRDERDRRIADLEEELRADRAWLESDL